MNFLSLSASQYGQLLFQKHLEINLSTSLFLLYPTLCTVHHVILQSHTILKQRKDSWLHLNIVTTQPLDQFVNGKALH